MEKLLLNNNRIAFYCVILLLMVNSTYANYAFKKKIKSVCSSYRVSVNTNAMDLGADLFSLNLESNRNNFEMVLLVGFASAGQAVSHQKSLGLSNSYIPNEIMVKVNVPASKGETMVFEAICSAEMAIQLAAGTLDSSEFMQKINLVTS